MDRKECNCFIRHARSEEERAAVAAGLARARALGDKSGVILALAALGQCSADR